MRAGSVFAILGVALIGLAIWPAEARSSRGGGTAHFGTMTSGRIVSGRTAGSLSTLQNQFFALNRFFSSPFAIDRLAALNRLGFNRGGLFSPFGSGEFGGFGGVGGFGGFDGFGGVDGFVDSPGIVGTTSPSIIAIPQFASEAGQPTRPRRIEDLPPCHETTSVGVIIERGMACSRARG
jgi:hypothetical protein